MPNTNEINETIESELQALKEADPIGRRAKLEEEITDISKILRSRRNNNEAM